jgi:hypothetical protein
MPRSRGAITGLLLVLLGAWGALIPFVGPRFGFAYTPDTEWTWTAARGWLEVFPGVTTIVGGLLLMGSGNRATAMFGGWLAAFGGAWFVVGRALAAPLRIGDIGHPVASTDIKRALLEISYFSGLGALIVFLAGGILARVSARLARDVEAAPVPASDVAPAEPDYETAYPAVSPDAVTQARANQGAVPEEEPRKTRRGLFRRHHANV